MTPELLAITTGTLAFVAALSGYLLGRSHGRASGYKRGLEIGKQTFAQDDAGRKREYERGLTIGSEGGRILAHMAATVWVNRKEWPLDGRTNVQRWMELGRREAHAACADMLCKRFNIETPKRKIDREV